MVYAVLAELPWALAIRVVYRVLLAVPAGTVAAHAGFHKSAVPVQDLFGGVHGLLTGRRFAFCPTAEQASINT